MMETMGQKYTARKEEIRKILPMECEKEVMKLVDDLYFDLKRALDGARALERILKENGTNIYDKGFLYHYMTVMAEEEMRFAEEYAYEDEEEGLEEEDL